MSVPTTARIVCQFSCGAASAVATKLAIADYGGTHDVQIINAFIKQEHPDNRRFLADCEHWFGRTVTVMHRAKFSSSTIEVFRKRRWMKGQRGAPCSMELKRNLLDTFNQPGDVLVFGFTVEEVDRFVDFKDRNPHKPAIAPLIERSLGKSDCKAMIQRAGIELPMMYRMGYSNANCIGCVKGGEGYFRAIREDFPAEFAELSAVQAEIGPGANFLRHRSGPLKNQRFPLTELPVGKARREEALPECSFYCEAAEAELKDQP